MCCPHMVPQRIVSLTPPVFGHDQNAPPMVRVVMVKPMHLDRKGMIWSGMAATMAVPADAGNAPSGRFRGRLGDRANCLPGKQEASVANAMVHIDLPHDRQNIVVQESSAIMALEEGLHPHPNGIRTQGRRQRKGRTIPRVTKERR